MKTRTYKDYDKFFTWLFKEPKNLIYETDITLKGNENTEDDTLIYYPTELRNIIKTQAVLRMARILQLGTMIYGYDRTYNTRLEHSKGTYFRSLNTVMNLYDIPVWKNAFEKKDNRKWIIAKIVNDLLHDVGHGPFSHSTEAICELPKGFHEDIGRRLILENEQLKNELDKIYPNLGKLIIEFQEKNPFGLASTSEGQIDVDRGDFLPRDEFFLKPTKGGYHSIDDVNKFFSNYTMKLVKDSDGKKVVRPVYKQEDLENILRFLETRFNRYKNYYYRVDTQVYSYIMKAFSERLLQSEEDYELKDFLKNNFRATPKDINLEEYIKWNDVKFLRGIVDVIENTSDNTLKQLGLMCIPNQRSMDSLLMGTYISNEQDFKNPSDEDIETIKKLKNISKYADQKYKNRCSENIMILDSSSEEDVKACKKKIDEALNISEGNEEENGIVTWKDKVVAYKKKKGEEIYIETFDEKIKEISELISESSNEYAKRVLNSSEEINGLIAILPIISEKNKDAAVRVKDIIEESNRENKVER